MSDLPNGWVKAPLADLMTGGLFTDGDWVETKDQDPAGGVRLVQLADVGVGSFRNRSSRFLNVEAANRLGCTYLRPGDVLVARMPEPIGRACLLPDLGQESVTAVDVCVVRPPSGLLPKYLMWWLNSPQAHGRIVELQSGTTRKRVSRKNLGTVETPLPPLAEQERIAHLIEEHFSHLDVADALLHRVQRNLERLWRRCLLDEVEGCADLVAIEDLASSEPNALAIGPFGSNLKVSDYRESGVPLVFVRDIRAGSFGGRGTKYVEKAKATELRSHEVCDGDVLVTKMGDPPGDTAVYRGPPAIITADCIKIRTAPSVVPEFVALALRTQRAMTEITDITRGVAQKKVSLGRFRKLVHIPLPPLGAQHEILQRLEAVRANVERQQRSVETALARTAATRRSVLAAAFAGDLVAQDPTDEPASELVDHIRSAASENRSRKGEPS